MQVRIRDLCGALDRATLTGSQEDWGERSQRLFEFYKHLSKRAGDQIIHLAGETADDIIEALRGLDLLLEEMECLALLQKSLRAPARPLTCLVSLETVNSI